MKFSVIVPVYNVEKYIVKCLESIQKQTLSDFECLVINDGTKDNSIAFAKEFFGSDGRFLFFDKENGGLSDARNYGIERARGEYIIFIDSDDYIDVTCLEKTYQKAREKDSDICVFDLYYVFDDRLEINSDNFEIDSYKNNKKLIFINNSANNKIYKTAFLQDKRFIKGIWYEDLASVPTWIAMANNVCRVSEPLYYYVQRSGSISHSANPKIFDIYFSINNIKETLGLNSDDVYQLYLNNCLVMTTLRIRDIEGKDNRLIYYRHNIELLDQNYSKWYQKSLKENYSVKQKVMFTLLKIRAFGLLDKIYQNRRNYE